MSKKLIILFLFASVLCRAQWNYVGNPGISPGWTMFNDVTTDTSGKPVIVYTESNISKTSVMEWNGSNWQLMGQLSHPSFASDFNDIQTGKKTNSCYLFYVDKQTQFPVCLKFNGQWTIAGSQPVISAAAAHATMALDTNETVYCAFNSQGTKIFRLTNNIWTPVSTNGLPSPIAWLELGFDKDNKLFLAYTDVTTLKAGCMTFDGSQWTQVGNSNFSSGYAQEIRMAFDSNNETYVSYYDSQSRCKKLNKNMNLWEDAGVLSSVYITAYDLVPDNSGNVYMTTNKAGYGDRIRCLKYNGTNWTELGSTGMSDTTAGFPSLATDKAGNLYSTYNDFIIAKSVVKKYSNVAGIKKKNETAKYSVYPNPSNGEINILNEMRSSLKITVYNHSGVAVRIIAGNSSLIQINGLKSGLYLIDIADSDGNASAKKVIISEN